MPGGFLDNYFAFNRQQRNGLIVLMCISLLLLVIRVAYPWFMPPGNVVVKDLPLIKMKLDSAYGQASISRTAGYSASYKKVRYFSFDPNTVSYDQLLLLGFSKKTAAIFLKFRAKGFTFRTREDLKKVFGVSERLYADLAPYVAIADQPVKGMPGPKSDLTAAPAKKQNTQPVDLNLADSAALAGINGIGPSYARRIIKYRSLLGGFVDVSQVKEVYGFPEALLEKIRPDVFVTVASVKKIDLNKDDFKTVNKHPYLSYEVTKTIFDWRRKTNITSTNLKDILNDPLLYAKILPYLTFD